MKAKKYVHSLVLAATVLLVACSTKNQSKLTSTNPFVEEISPIQIGRLTPVVIRFTQVPQCAPEAALSLKPEQHGSWSMRDDYTAIFTPKTPYKAGSKITLAADCGKLFGKEHRDANFTDVFFIAQPSYDVHFDGLEVNDEGNGFVLGGTVSTDIPLSSSIIEGIVTVKIGSGPFAKKLPVSWDNDNEQSSHHFLVKNIEQFEKERTLTASWSGKKLGLSAKQDKLMKGEKTYLIPSPDLFTVMNVDTSSRDKIVVSFSQPVDTTQNFCSFVKYERRPGATEPAVTSSIRKNVVTLYNDNNWNDISGLNITKEVKSIGGIYLAAQTKVTLSENWDIPEVRFVTEGNILPSSQGTTIPIETKNLSGIIVQAFAISDSSIMQFLQVNDLDGENELYRVGEPVWTKDISIPWDDSMQNKFISRGIDLTELSKKYPGGMFQIRLTFRHNDIKYVCHAGHRDFSNLEMPPVIFNDGTPEEKSWWDYWDDMPYSQRESYWSYNEDPCHPAFYTERYNSNINKKRNIIITDVGVMAKMAADGDLYVTAADLRTAGPIPSADISLYSFIGKKIGSAKADANGCAVFKNADKAVVVTASNGKQISYLKLSEGTGLSTSHFEIGGEKATNGVKGFIYGERGVWRPGDQLFLTFVLQDLKNTIPANMPLTFEFQDPLGRITDTQTLTTSVNGFYAITEKTAGDAPTGLWQARVKLGGQTWSKSLRIETVVPNRLSVNLTTDEKYLVTRNNRLTLKGAWLHGAPTPNYNADVSVLFTQAATAFDGYSDYTFTNPSHSVTSSRETIWEDKLDGSSKADITVNLDAGDNLPGMLNAQFISRVFEPSGMFSTEQTSFLYSPYDRYVGMKLPKGDATRGMLLTDTNHTTDVVLLTPEGKPVNSATLSYTIYQLNWKWWWEKDALTDATYVSSDSYYRVASGNCSIKDGKGSFTFMVKYPSWGRYLVVVSDGSSGHSAGKIVYIDWPGWAGRAQENGSGSASMVALVCDKNEYNVNDTASITFASSAGERALVTIEKSGDVMKQEWIQTTQDTTVYKLPLSAAMAPNVYVHVTLLQPHQQTANSLPIRLYGVVPVKVSDPSTVLKPVIETSALYHPGDRVTISVSEESKRPMTYTLAIVDEGLLGLTAFKAPNLRNEFYKKEASQLKNWDIYRYVMNAFSGKLETLISVGGSEDAIDNRDRSANRFTPVVKYLGPYFVDAGQKQNISLTIPQYIGAVRIMAVAGNKGAYGTAEKTVPVKSDLMVQASLPRTLGTNESIKVPVTLFNGTETQQNINVNFNVMGAVTTMLTQTVTVPSQGNQTIEFRVNTAGEGKATFVVVARGNAVAAQSSTDVQVVSRGVPVTYQSTFTVPPNSEAKVSVQTPGEKNTTKTKVELSTLPMINLSTRLSYLLQYPHGCIEQITSGGFPQLFIPGIIKLSDKDLDSVKLNVKSVIDRYPTYQTASGGFAYWPGNSSPSAWGSCYGAHFILEAEKNGYKVPDTIKGPLLSWIASSASSWTGSDSDYDNDGDSNVQAYKLYVLAEAGQADVGAMNRLLNKSNLSDETRLLLASAYAMAGRTDTAQSLLQKVPEQANGTSRKTGGSFSSSWRNVALQLFASSLANNGRTAAKCAKTIADGLSSDKWMSTQETAWCLMAILPYYKGQTGSTTGYFILSEGNSYSGSIANGTVIENVTAGAGATQNVSVRNTGAATLYGTLSASGMSVPGTETKQNETIEMKVTYYDEAGNTLNPTSIKPGDSFSFNVMVNNYNYSSGDISNIALTIPLPTCWELSNDRVGAAPSSSSYDDDSSSSTGNSSYTYQDIRDDAVYTYFDLKSDSSFSYTFYATATYTGNYYIPAIHAEAMYDNDIRAMIPGRYVSTLR
jgi:uncharacterized protein YfaS (alpha-2-macroglobulin family)